VQAKQNLASDADAIAIVSWSDSKYAQVVIDVGTTFDGLKRWISRKVEFQPVDAIEERWRVIGLTIATLVGDLEEAQKNEILAKEASSAIGVVEEPKLPENEVVLKPAPRKSVSIPTQHPIAPMKKRTSKGSPWTVSAGSSLNPETPRLGAWLRGTVMLLSPVFTSVALSYALRPRDSRGVFMTWMGVATGGGVGFGIPDWRLTSRFRMEFLLERVAASATDSNLDRGDERWKLLSGGRGGVELIWSASNRFGVLGGAEGTLYAQPVRVRWAGERVAEFPALTYGLVLGAEIRFD
jgi:hypothetical protein